jgi:hypothetical protein
LRWLDGFSEGRIPIWIERIFFDGRDHRHINDAIQFGALSKLADDQRCHLGCRFHFQLVLGKSG